MEPWTSHRPVNRFAGLPRGVLGRFGGWVMARGGNASQHEVLGLLPVEPGDRVLEVGHGPGVLIRLLLESTEAAFVAGVDPSDVMRSQASKAVAGAILQGRADIRAGTADSVPYGDASFDHTVSVNNVAIWPSLAPGVAELCRVTRPGGTVAIAWHSRTSPSRPERSMALDEDGLDRIQRALRRHCAQVVRHDLTHVVCFTAVRRQVSPPQPFGQPPDADSAT
ncbi:class I SAM-dependent methyltransferase [Kitasatospora sp. NPDC056651]|uniref:class I SAM-dependent methyltransferase n=1 Tax=Kitasatospora sp. NPDC056651 TaxID=3345892 RepID=UPI0036C3B275